MELEQPGLMRQSHLNIMNKYINPRNGKGEGGPSQPPRNDLRRHSESFRKLGVGVPTVGGASDAETRLTWVRSQIVGSDAEFDSPFGRRRLTYADSTASGRCVCYIEDFIVDSILPFYGNSHTSDSHVGHRTTKTVHEASSYIKRCLGGGPEDAILFCGSGSTGSIKRLQEVMGIAVPSTLRERMIKCMPSEERWVVLVGPYEHHSNLLSWRQSLAEVIEIGLDAHGLIDKEDLRQKLESYRDANRPILGSFSACSNVTGICTDTRAVAKLLHQFGAFACFDFAASAPYAEIDMRSGEVDGYDAIFLSVHKFLGGPGSPGILLMSKVLYQLGSSPPSTCGEKRGTKGTSLSMDLLLPLSSMTSLAFKREAGVLVPVHMVMPFLASMKLSPVHLDVPLKRLDACFLSFITGLCGSEAWMDQSKLSLLPFGGGVRVHYCCTGVCSLLWPEVPSALSFQPENLCSIQPPQKHATKHNMPSLKTVLRCLVTFRISGLPK